MRKRKKLFPYLIGGIVGIIALALFIDISDPSYSFVVEHIAISTITIFFALSLLSIFALFSFVFLNRRRGILLSLCVNSILLLRYFGYKNIFYDVLLALIFVLIEYSFIQQKPKTPKSRVSEISKDEK